MKQLVKIISLYSTLIPLIDTAAEAVNRPNILLIAVDDMGYSDIAPFGGEINTPTWQVNGTLVTPLVKTLPNAVLKGLSPCNL